MHFCPGKFKNVAHATFKTASKTSAFLKNIIFSKKIPVKTESLIGKGDYSFSLMQREISTVR